MRNNYLRMVIHVQVQDVSNTLYQQSAGQGLSNMEGISYSMQEMSPVGYKLLLIRLKLWDELDTVKATGNRRSKSSEHLIQL